ncbi:MAG: DUF86 domain-containing protein [Phycisphaeraceae bacterium]|nr:DUF86 domain-containing protein [Phycisphaeraceae bacterium]
MQPEIARYLCDMLTSGKLIQEYARGKTIDEFSQHAQLRDAVRWNFCIIGEALSQLARQDESIAVQITDYQKIIGLRNQLIHGYEVIDDAVLWYIKENHLPVLMNELQMLLQS